MIRIMAGAGPFMVFSAMKPSIPDTGTVIRLEGNHAVVRMRHEGSCSKCGAAAVGLCKGGLKQELVVENSKRAGVGNTVKIGLVQAVQLKAYILAYAIPAAALVFGTAGGHILGAYAGFPPLDILAGFTSLIAVSFFSLRRLKRLNAISSIEIVDVLAGPGNPEASRTDEETVRDYALSSF